jgi:hypothetical protein
VSSSQNGWPIVSKSACDQGPFMGVKLPNGILAGDVATIARWQMRLYSERVEPLKAGTCWGWFVKVIEGTTTHSNHGSATAWDLNADQHPMGTPAHATMGAEEIAECDEIVRLADGVLRWGGRYTGRPDPMHWEIVGTPAETHAFATKIRKADRPVEEITFDVTYPLLGEGDDDNLRDGYDVIRRIQRQLGITADGVWGPKTSAALGVKKMTEEKYRSLFAGSR